MQREGLGLHMILNAYWHALDFELPPERAGDPWRRWIDTSRESPDDIVPWQTAAAVEHGRKYRVGPRSVVVLWRRLEPAAD
jgi:isoamylase